MSPQHDTHTQRILDLLTHKGLLRPSDLDSTGASRAVLARMTAAGLLEKVDRGLYRLPDQDLSENESLITVATKVFRASSPRRLADIAKIAMIWSPSTMAPV